MDRSTFTQGVIDLIQPAHRGVGKGTQARKLLDRFKTPAEDGVCDNCGSIELKRQADD